MVYLGVGCESAAAANDRRSQALLAASTRVWTRDSLSTELLAAAYPSAAIQTGSDLAHLEFEIGVSSTPEQGVLGLLIAYEREGAVPTRALEDLIEGRPGAPLRWLIQEERSFPYTERWSYAALTESTQQQMSVMPFDYHHDSVDAFLAHFGSPEIVVSTRYHGTLVAAWQGSRVAVIARSAKLRGIAEDLDLPWTEHIATAADLRTLIERARPARPERLNRQSARAATMCDEFFTWLRES
jgi:polysaccharide pyruvyl transferase WcaK-like protein